MSIDTCVQSVLAHIPSADVCLVAVSKTKPVEMIQEAYDAGIRDFGENKVQEMTEKHTQLPTDIHWHMIGHLQTNKVKYIAPYVHLIHSVDSLKLLKEINKQADKNQRIIQILIQAKIATEETKYGCPPADVPALLEIAHQCEHIRVKGLMGMASFVEDAEVVRAEFMTLKSLYDECRNQYPSIDTLSMGMSGDYHTAIECGSTMVRVGSAIFGKRTSSHSAV